MDPDTPLDAPNDAERRAQNAAFFAAALRKLSDLSIELATLIVEDVRTAATETAAISKQPAADVDMLFRGVRRGALLSDKLLAPPKPEPASGAERPAGVSPRVSQGSATRYPGDDRLDRLDRLDQLDDIDEIDDIDDLEDDLRTTGRFTDGEKILEICRKYNITNRYGQPSIFTWPLHELEALVPQVEEVLRTVMAKYGVISAEGIHPDRPPNEPRPDTS